MTLMMLWVAAGCVRGGGGGGGGGGGDDGGGDDGGDNSCCSCVALHCIELDSTVGVH